MPKSLLFIPDISGFTEFVHSTESEHSRHIISELLEVLIDSNELGLELAEVEGDALFFYKNNSIPSEVELQKQVEKMYLGFHNHLKAYEFQRICPCGACETATNLKLKFVAHSGDLDFIKIKETSKPYGKVVIQTHRALKNSIPLSEYLLVSKTLNEEYSEIVSTNWTEGSDNFDFGDFEYKYLDLNDLKERIDPFSPTKYNGSVKPDLSVSREIPVSPNALFELVSNLDYRLHWTLGVNKLTYEKNKINRSGTQHICVFDSGTVNVESFADRTQHDKLILGEKTLDPSIAESISTLYIVDRDSSSSGSHLTIEARIEGKGIIYKLLKPIILYRFRKILNNVISTIADNASRLVEELKIN